MAKKSSIFSGKKARKSSVDKFKESDLYKKIYGKTHEERVKEYLEWKESHYFTGQQAHDKIKKIAEDLEGEDYRKFREYIDQFQQDYDVSDKMAMYDVVRQLDYGKSISDVIKPEKKDITELPPPNPNVIF